MSAAPASRQAVVVGAGIAGAAVAYELGRAGWAVTVVDAGEHTASHVPSALVNPVRGQSGQVAPRALEGLRRTWALVEELAALGFAVPHGREGLHRPVPDAATQERFVRHLPGTLAHRWLAPEEVPDLPRGWHSVLWVPEGGWLDGPALCRASLRASGAQVRRARATRLRAGEVELEGGEVLRARVVVDCGGSAGAAWAGRAGTHRAGSLLLTRASPVKVPRSFGAYLAPATRGGVLGATFERPSPTLDLRFPAASLDWLLQKGLTLTAGRGLEITGHWSGSRLSGLRAGPRESGVWELTGLGSKGFLLGPLLARELVVRLEGT